MSKCSWEYSLVVNEKPIIPGAHTSRRHGMAGARAIGVKSHSSGFRISAVSLVHLEGFCEYRVNRLSMSLYCSLDGFVLKGTAVMSPSKNRCPRKVLKERRQVSSRNK